MPHCSYYFPCCVCIGSIVVSQDGRTNGCRVEAEKSNRLDMFMNKVALSITGFETVALSVGSNLRRQTSEAYAQVPYVSR